MNPLIDIGLGIGAVGVVWMTCSIVWHGLLSREAQRNMILKEYQQRRCSSDPSIRAGADEWLDAALWRAGCGR